MIYLDHNSTTPCAPEVIEAMRLFWSKEYGNPSSSHAMGRRAAVAVKTAREQVASLANALSTEIVFTSGATESNNMLFLGVLLAPRTERQQIVVSAIEHKSVLEPARMLEDHGFEIVKLPVNREGITDVDAARALITNKALLVSVQAANNEIGSLQPIAELADIAHENGAYFHTDAAQVLGKVPFDVESINCDFASFSAHKLYGPKGVGALFMRGGPHRWPWATPFRGGGQEGGLRSGTHNVPASVGFGEACRIAAEALDKDIARCSSLRNSFELQILDLLPETIIVGAGASRIYGTSCMILSDVPADVLLARASNLCISSGSACTSGVVSPSHVILACGFSRDDARCMVRVSFGRYSTRAEANQAATQLSECVTSIRDFMNSQARHSTDIKRGGWS